MKLQVLQENLTQALNLTSRFSQQRAQLPVLANVVFQAQKAKLNLLATNLEVSVSTSIGAKVEKQGELALPGRLIFEIIDNLSPGQVNLQAVKEQLEISTANFKSTLAGMNVADFPAIPQKISTKAIKLPVEDFTQALSKVAFSASIDETRPILTGVLFIFKKGSLMMVATDGFRLSQKKIKIPGLNLSEKVILPKNSLVDFAKILSQESENFDLEIKSKENQVVFGTGKTILATKVLEGTFPDFEKIIPQSLPLSLKVDREELRRAIRLGAVFARESANMIKLRVQKNSLQVLAESARSGKQEMEIDARVEGLSSVGQTLEIAYNYRFLEEFINVVNGEEIKMEFSDSASPGVFSDSADSGLLHLIMPVKLQ